MAAADNGNGRIEYLHEWLQRVEKKLDKYLHDQAETCATVKQHTNMLRWFGAILAAVVVATIGHILGVR